MIKANELRLGNYVKDGISGAILIVSSISEEGIGTTVLDRSKYPLKDGWYISPIDLSPEILEKCGFVKHRDSERILSFELDKHLSITTMPDGYYPMILQDAEFSNGELNVVSLNRINYLHELQNICYYLTGEELTVNL